MMRRIQLMGSTSTYLDTYTLYTFNFHNSYWFFRYLPHISLVVQLGLGQASKLVDSRGVLKVAFIEVSLLRFGGLVNEHRHALRASLVPLHV